MVNPLRTLQEYGQSVWLDFVSRDLLKSGGLAKLIAEDGLGYKLADGHHGKTGLRDIRKDDVAKELNAVK